MEQFHSKMKRVILFVLISACLIVVSCNKNKLNQAEFTQVEVSNDGIKNQVQFLDSPHSSPSVSLSVEQNRFNTIIRSLKKLPDEELERLGIKNIIEQSYLNEIDCFSLDGSKISAAWSKRQIELAEAMQQVVKPVEHMASIIAVLKQYITNITNSEYNNSYNITNYMIELEGLVSDIDNARDFHTIGGWPILVRCLESFNSIDIQSTAALVIGTIVKNDYDYQLWGLETFNNLTAIDRLINLLDETSDITCMKRVLYAISSLARGNLDIQQVLYSDNFIDKLLSIIEKDNLQVVTKVYLFILDMLMERQYITSDLVSSLNEKLSDELKAIQLLGDKFISKRLYDLTISKLKSLSHVEIEKERSLIYHMLGSCNQIIKQSNGMFTRDEIELLLSIVKLYENVNNWKDDDDMKELISSIKLL